MVHLEYPVFQELKEKWVQVGTEVKEVRLEFLEREVHKVRKEKKEDKEILVFQVHKEKRVKLDLLERLVHLEFKDHLD